MGARKKAQKIQASEMPPQSPKTFPGNISAPAKNLRKGDLGGVIFGCKHSTKDECLTKQLFGLPSPHFSYVRNIEPTLPLFLFNYSDRKLHGIYEAASQGQMYIDSYAWTENGTERTAFPAQVRIRIRTQCQPLTEKQYFEIIKDNYYSKHHFWFELDHAQMKGLIALFKPSPIPYRTIPLPVPSSRANIFPTSTSNKWKAPANSEHTNTGACEQKWNSKSSVGLGNANKFASLMWDDGCSSKTSKSALKEDEIREPISDWETDWVGENVHGGHSGVSPHLDGVSQTWHDSWSKTLNDAHEERELKESVSNWEVDLSGENMQGSDSTVNLYLTGESQAFHGCSNKASTHAPNERELKESTSGWEADWSEENLQDSPSGVGPCPGGERQSLSEQQSGAESFEMVLQKLQNLNAAREHSSSKVFIDESDMHRGVHEEIILSNEPFVLAEEENETTTNLSGDVHVESRLHESFAPAEVRENTTTSDPYHENAELVQIIKELKETTEALEKKQVESDLEMQQLRNAVKESRKVTEELKAHVKELESKLSLVSNTSNDFVKQYLGSEKVIYLIGGFNGTSWLSALDSFSPSTNIVKPLKPMTSARSYASAAALNGNLYVFGGGDGNSWFDTVECYSPGDDEWTSCPHLIRPKGSLAGATLSGKIFAIGGGDGYECFSDVEMLDLALGRWINIQPMLQKRFAPGAAELHGALYAVGGYDGKCYLQSVERYDPRDGYWTRIPGMKTRRGCHSLAVFNEKLYALGGYDGEKMVPSIESFDPRLGTWMVDEPMSFARGYSAAAVIGDFLYVIGGVKDGDRIMDTIECYKEGTAWTVTGFKAIGTRCFFSAIVL